MNARVTRILNSLESGNGQAAEELLPLVYDELRKLAAAKMAHEPANQTLQPTALVHEAWLRLTRERRREMEWASALLRSSRRSDAPDPGGQRAAQTRRRATHVEHHQRLAERGRHRSRRAGKEAELLAINESLEKLAALDKQKAELVKLRYFVGLTIEESAAILGVSVPTANRWWTYARAWLYQQTLGR